MKRRRKDGEKDGDERPGKDKKEKETGDEKGKGKERRKEKGKRKKRRIAMKGERKVMKEGKRAKRDERGMEEGERDCDERQGGTSYSVLTQLWRSYEAFIEGEE